MELIIALGITALIAGAISLPLVFAMRRRATLRKPLFLLNLGLFAMTLLLIVGMGLGGHLLAADSEVVELPAGGNSSSSWAFIAAALAVGTGSIGAGIAVAAAAPAAIGALAENENNFGKAMIFVGLGEGLAIFGLLVAILILQKVP